MRGGPTVWSLTSTRPIPDRLRDWISIPKANGYESLHTTVMSPTGKWVEVQIRSERMDEIAEKGYAAHWRYKGQRADSRLDQWIGQIREVIEGGEDSALGIRGRAEAGPLQRGGLCVHPQR